MTTEFAVDRVYFSGCWDSNGHEVVRTQRYRCESLDDVNSLFSNFLSMSNTKTVKALRFSRFRNCYEVFCVRTPSPEGSDDCEITLPAGSKDRNIVQSTLF